MEGKDVFKYTLKRSEKSKPLPTKTSIKFRSKGGATFISKPIISKVSFWQMVVLLTLTVAKT